MSPIATSIFSRKGSTRSRVALSKAFSNRFPEETIVSSLGNGAPKTDSTLWLCTAKGRSAGAKIAAPNLGWKGQAKRPGPKNQKGGRFVFPFGVGA
jgi:hypothetical protein